METKKHIRQEVLRQRDALTGEERSSKSRRILEYVREMEAYRKSRVLLVYASYRSEVETLPLIRHALEEGKLVYCPKVEQEGQMNFYRISSIEDLKEGYRGIPEPEAVQELLYCGQEYSAEDTLMILPGAVFDRERNRIGYGKGYYDRYLEQYPDMECMALCFDCQIREHLPAEEHDRKPGQIISESGVLDGYAGDDIQRK